MQVFEQEKQDGLESALSNKTIAYNTLAKTNRKKAQANFLKSTASNPGQLDLYYMDAILATVGWNENDDIFDPVDMWNARNTPVDKQFNFMHDEKDIIGHITASKVLDFENEEYTGDSPPEKYHLVVSSVLYTFWQDETLHDRMTKILAEIEEGKWFVSMECLFNKFDYGIVTPDGQQKIIARNEETSFLTKHLRSYGGAGEFKGHKLGRVLRDFTFSGKGLVDNPANPESIIFNATKEFIGSKASIWETNMTDEQRVALEAELKAAKASLEKAESDKVGLFTRISDLEKESSKEALDKVLAEKEELAQEKATIATAKAEVEKELDALKADVAAKDQTIAKLEEDKESLSKEKAELSDKLSEIETSAIKAARKAKLVNAGVEDAKADELNETFASVTDEAFDQLVAAYTPKSEDKKKKKDESADAGIGKDDVEQTEAALKGEEQEEDLQAARASVAKFLTSSLK